MDFWKVVNDASEKAKTLAQTVSKKGMEIAEATAEEATKKLKDINLHEAIGAGTAKTQTANQEELVAYGITSDYIDFIKSVNYSVFRDFPADQVIQEPGTLNPWQVRHAALVVTNVKEVDELRFVLCPRYMDDEKFWAVYFTLARKQLPEKAFSWVEGDELPFAPAKAAPQGDAEADFIGGIGTQLQQFGKKIQQATTQHGAGGLSENLSYLLPTGGGLSTSPGGTTTTIPADSTATPNPTPANSGRPMLESDPDLEAYLQVAIAEAAMADDDQEGGGDGGGGEGGEDDEDDLDLDKYLNELSADVEDEEEEEAVVVDKEEAVENEGKT